MIQSGQGNIRNITLASAASLMLGACAGVSGYQQVSETRTVSLAPGEDGQFITVTCPAGKKVLGGGRSYGGFFTITNDGPISDTEWQVLVINRSDVNSTAQVRVTAICADAAE